MSSKEHIQTGDTLPNIKVYESDSDLNIHELNTLEIFSEGKHIIFGLPGAFTPKCSESHLPGYLEQYKLLKEKGIKSINCVSVNDPFVMHAWGEAHNAIGKAIGLDIDLSATLGNVRSKRYVMLVKECIVKHIEVEPLEI
ncbi:peroxiredoxin-5, mitochondrial-like isoform X2 [Argonauta hians]